MKLTRKTATKLAQNKHGAGAFIRDNGIAFRDGTPRPIDDDDRNKLRAQLTECKALEPVRPRWEELPDEMTLGELRLKIGEWRLAHAKWKKVFTRKQHYVMNHRFDVGHMLDIGWSMIDGSADTLAEALRKAGIEVPP